MKRLLFALIGLVAFAALASANPFFSNYGAAVYRLFNRTFMGGATVNDGAYPNVTKDWFSQFQTAQEGLGNSLLVSTQAAVLNDPTNASAAVAFLTGVDTAPQTALGPTMMSDAFFAINDNTSIATPVWGLYGEAQRLNSIAGETTGAEIEVRNLGNSISIDPFAFYASGMTSDLQLGAGAGLAATGQNNASMAELIFPNPKAFNAGIVIANGSLAAPYQAIELPSTYNVTWYSAAGVVAGSATVDGTGTMQITAPGGIFLNGRRIVSP